MSKTYEILSTLINKYLTPENTSNEIEFKFGKFDNVFKVGVNIDQFTNISNEYKKKELLIPEQFIYLNIIFNDIRIQLFDNTKKQIMEFARTNTITKSMNYTILTKNRDNNDNTLIEYGIKLSLASEEDITNKISLEKLNYDLKTTKRPILYRYIQRNTFNIAPGLKLDLSTTKQAAGATFIDSKILSQQEKYEIELEIYNYTEYSLDFNNLVLNNIYRIALIINGGFSLSKFSLISEVQDEFFKKYGHNIHAHNVSLGKKDVITIKSEYHVFTDKTDGFRHLLFINKFGEMYLINNREEVFNTEIVNPDLHDSLFDGELFYIEDENRYEFNIFDGLFINDIDIRGLAFYDNTELSIYSIKDSEYIVCGQTTFKRYNYFDKNNNLINEYDLRNRKNMRYARIEEVFIKPNTRYGHILNIFNTKNSNHDNKLSILTKSFYPLNMIINISEKFHILIINTTAQTITMPNKSYLFDGLIIQLANGTYPIRLEPNKNPIWNDSYKWKFANNITIDFKITDIEINTELNKATANLRDKSDKIFTKMDFELVNGKFITRDNNNISNNLIVECNYENDKWNIIKIRYDKTSANAPRTVIGTVELIKNPVLLEELIE